MVLVLLLLIGPFAQFAPAETLTFQDDLIVWLRADVGVLNELGNPTASGDEVNTWEDQATAFSSNARTVNDFFNTFNRPAWLADGGPNDNAYVSFTSGGSASNSDWLRAEEFFDFSDFTIFAVATGAGNGSQLGSIFWDYGNVGNKQVRMTVDASGDAFDAYVRDDDKHQIDLGSGTLGENLSWNVLSSRLSGNQFDLFVNGDLLDSQSNVNYDSTTWEGTYGDPVMGTISNFESTHFLDGGISEFLIYRGALTDSEREEVENYLLQRNLGIPEPTAAALLTLGLLTLLPHRPPAGQD